MIIMGGKWWSEYEGEWLSHQGNLTHNLATSKWLADSFGDSHNAIHVVHYMGMDGDRHKIQLSLDCSDVSRQMPLCIAEDVPMTMWLDEAGRLLEYHYEFTAAGDEPVAVTARQSNFDKPVTILKPM